MVLKKKTTARSKKAAPKKAVKKTVRKAAPKKAVKKAAPKKAVKKVAAKKTAKKGTRKASGLTKMTYNVSAELEAIVGSKSLTRPEIVKKLWAYIKSHKCQDAVNRRMINPDAKLSKVIGNKPVDMLKLAGHISKHIK
jgi:upstream activation factor subunit UAF30